MQYSLKKAQTIINIKYIYILLKTINFYIEYGIFCPCWGTCLTTSSSTWTLTPTTSTSWTGTPRTSRPSAQSTRRRSLRLEELSSSLVISCISGISRNLNDMQKHKQPLFVALSCSLVNNFYSSLAIFEFLYIYYVYHYLAIDLIFI